MSMVSGWLWVTPWVVWAWGYVRRRNRRRRLTLKGHVRRRSTIVRPRMDHNGIHGMSFTFVIKEARRLVFCYGRSKSIYATLTGKRILLFSTPDDDDDETDHSLKGKRTVSRKGPYKAQEGGESKRNNAM